MSSLLIRRARIIDPESGEEKEGDIFLQNGRIAAIYQTPSVADRVIEADGLYAAPGFIDMHVHGIKGVRTADAKSKSIETMSKTLACHGVTSFLPALHSCDPGLLNSSMTAIASLRGKPLGGARLLGIYLEGPFVSPEKPGAMNKKYFKQPSPEDFNRIYKASGGC